ncbi:uncharacterized protein Z518_07769 [Rhinocladiella mackenziei CBS 650.93]|uniref:Uncharacterized protein n=1 Tax=Rhinocladiella mackenziei CBS 650.93 TaxID=1442369 RepID=A0A0D2J5B9_9EURO|nr:uncharacterized protein Z518_07769 [Rhinocladiella mackenziei CBS 650.93]KIX04215.1 hypothetical protein Z518_07769 [Rhinocladiella mackenziei CBS 650.93]
MGVPPGWPPMHVRANELSQAQLELLTTVWRNLAGEVDQADQQEAENEIENENENEVRSHQEAPFASQRSVWADLIGNSGRSRTEESSDGDRDLLGLDSDLEQNGNGNGITSGIGIGTWLQGIYRDPTYSEISLNNNP